MVRGHVSKKLCKCLCNGIAMLVEGVVGSTVASRRAYESLVTSYGVGVMACFRTPTDHDTEFCVVRS